MAAGCAETELLVHTAKRAKDAGSAGSAGYYKVGNPYQIGGVWYYPAVDWSYQETGIASWYGPGFHGRSTANGETFDENAITAAHRTLPMPSVVRVTNLGNGRSLVVRVNDRGPFAHGRIIDLSRRSAQLLGFERNGTAKVKLELLPNETRQVQTAASGGPRIQVAEAEPAPKPDSVPAPPVQVASLKAPAGAEPAPVRAERVAPPPAVSVTTDASPPPLVTTVPVERTDIFVQAGAFEDRSNASRLSSRLAAFGRAHIQEALVSGRTFYRVRIGPIADVEQADRVLNDVIVAGYPGSRIVVD